MNYVCGFLFSYDLNNFVLILKNKGPVGMEGKWNGIGGEIQTVYPLHNPHGAPGFSSHSERLEFPHQAMERGFQEETGLLVKADRWRCFHIVQYEHTNNKCYFFAAFGDDIKKVKTVTDEMVKIFSQEDFVFMHENETYYDVRTIILMVISSVKSGYFALLNPEGVNSK